MPLFHLHIDAIRLAPELHDLVRDELGFVDSQFTHLAIDVLHFEAPMHLTLKTDQKAVLKSTFNRLKSLFAGNEGFRGYLEAEIILYDEALTIAPNMSHAALPFVAKIGSLPANDFRQTELHIDFVNEDPRCSLAEALRAMGFYTAHMLKPRGLAQIFTLQGSKDDILAVSEPVRAFVKASGGGTHCSIKEERIVDWWVSDPTVALPPVIKRVEWARR